MFFMTTKDGMLLGQHLKMHYANCLRNGEQLMMPDILQAK